MTSNPDTILKQFMYVLDEIRKIFYNKNDSIMSHLRGRRFYRGPRYFQVLFLSLTGLNGDVEKYYEENYDNYYSMIKNILLEMPIPEHYKRQIGAKMRLVKYHNKAVLIIKIINDNGAVMFENDYYTRICANNDPTPVSPENMPSFFAQFV